MFIWVSRRELLVLALPCGIFFKKRVCFQTARLITRIKCGTSNRKIGNLEMGYCKCTVLQEHFLSLKSSIVFRDDQTMSLTILQMWD